MVTPASRFRKNIWKANERTRFVITAFVSISSGFLLGIYFRVNFRSSLLASSVPKFHDLKIWAPKNPLGAERLAPVFIEPESDYYLHRLWGQPSEDLKIKPKYLVAFTVDYARKKNVDAAVNRLSENFTVVLFHYDGWTSEWDEFEWSKRAIHVSARKQSKWWYIKRFLHPDIVAPYEYIFIWDDDLEAEHFDAEKYLQWMRTHGLEISQPAVEQNKGTRRKGNQEFHNKTEEKPDCCTDPHLPTCATSVEIMTTIFSRGAWRCAWHMIQNDLVHGWGLDFALRKYVEPAYEKKGVLDAQWIVHRNVFSHGNQAQEWCKKEWTMFQDRVVMAEKTYFEKIRSNPSNSTAR